MPPLPQCPACSRSVYPAEAFMAVDRTPFHRACVKCRQCGKVALVLALLLLHIIDNYYYHYWQALTSASINEHQLQLYCSLCYANIFQTGVRQCRTK